MATLAVNLPPNAGEFLRSLSKKIAEISYDIPDQTPTGGTNVLTIDNSPSTGTVSVQVTSGPNQTKKKHS